MGFKVTEGGQILVSTGLPTNDWRAVGPAAQEAEELGFDQVKANEILNDSFASLVPAALSTKDVELATSVAIAFPRSPMIVASLAWDLHRHTNGRFVLGLGSQVKGHNERRFSVPWSPPAPRLSEYVRSLRAIWRCWEKGDQLNFEGKHYTFTLMTPEFAPEPTGLDMVPVTIAAVGPAMLRLAGRHCDGVRLHGFCTRDYIEQTVMQEIEAGFAQSGRNRANFEISGGGFVATGPDEESVRKAAERIRYRVAFYGSTRAYRPVLAQHGLEDLGEKLTGMVKAGAWDEIAGEISDDVLSLFAAIGTYDELPKRVEERYGGVVDSVSISLAPDTDPDVARQLVKDLRAIPGRFEGFATAYEDAAAALNENKKGKRAMKGIVFLGERKLELREYPDPDPGPRDVVLEIKASGMCGTDLHRYRRALTPEEHFIAGHEPCGVVVEVGSAVTEYEARVGDRVMVHHYDGCGVCRHCQSGWTQLCDETAVFFGSGLGHGAHARYMKAPAHTLVPLPDELSFPAGAAVACGTGTAYGAIKRLGLEGDQTLAVFGQGPVGLSATQLGAEMGARVIAFDIVPERRALALEKGATAALDPNEVDPVTAIKELTHGAGAHKTIDTSSAHEARLAAVRSTRTWGSACFVGVGGEITLEVSRDLIRRQVSVLGHLTFSKMGQADCARFIADRKIDIDGLFTHEWTLDQADEAYRLFDQQKTGKGVFLPS